MRAKRFLVPGPREVSGAGAAGICPPVAIYHAVSRCVDRDFKFGDAEKEQLRVLLRMYERFSGCRVLAYALMSNHLHVMLEVPPGCGKGEALDLSDEELLHRLGGLYSTAYVEGVRGEIAEARELMAGRVTRPEGAAGLDEYEEEAREKMVAAAKVQGERMLAAVYGRYCYRMQSLPEFFKGMLQRFTCWFNREHGRKGTLWESRFRSTVVQDGLAARTVAAYIDLNPVRAGICEDPADYRWSSYGEAVGGGRGVLRARAGLVRALSSFDDAEPKARTWAQGGVGKAYRKVLMMAGMEEGETRGNSEGEYRVVTRRGMDRTKAEAELERLEDEKAWDLKISKVIQCRVRYFTEGGVIGTKQFVNDFFVMRRELFSAKRNDGARRARGNLEEMAGELWAMRDLQRE